MKKYKILGFVITILFYTSSFADSVILMMGDGMGFNHLRCANFDKPVYIYTLPVKGEVRTNSYQNATTDSAAGATAYACGIKTKNGYLGKDPNGNDCTTIAEEAVKNNIAVGIYSTDSDTGASPSAFYSHVASRGDTPRILEYKTKASTEMDILLSVKKLSEIVKEKLEKLDSSKKEFFTFFEGAKIDKRSHDNNIQAMKTELYDFDKAVFSAVDYVYQHPDTTLIILADHETGGINDQCEYTTRGHTNKNIPLFSYGKHAHLFQGEHENIDIYSKIKTILNMSE